MTLKDARIQFNETLQQDLEMSESSEGEAQEVMSNVEGSKYDLGNIEFTFDPTLFDTIVKPADYSSKIDQKLPETTTGENGAIPLHVGTYSPELLKTPPHLDCSSPKISQEKPKTTDNPASFEKNPQFHLQLLCLMKM